MAQMQIEKMGVKHTAILDFILLHQGKVTQEDVARHFGMTRVWISCIMNSDAFRAALKERQNEIGEMVNLTVADRINGVAAMALEKLGAMVETTLDPDFTLDVADKLLQRAGYGSRAGPVAVVNNNTQINNYIPVERNVLEECRQQMVAQANRAQPRELPSAEECDIFENVVLPALSAPVTVSAGGGRSVGGDSEE